MGTSRLGFAGRAGLPGRARGLGLTGGLARWSPTKRKRLVEPMSEEQEAELHLPPYVLRMFPHPSMYKSNVTASMKASWIFQTHPRNIFPHLQIPEMSLSYDHPCTVLTFELLLYPFFHQRLHFPF